MNKLLTSEDRRSLHDTYVNADFDGDDFLMGHIKAAAEMYSMDFDQAVEIFGLVIDWEGHPNIDDDEDAQAIGGEVLRLLRDSEQEFEEGPVVAPILTGCFLVIGYYSGLLAMVFAIALLLREAMIACF